MLTTDGAGALTWTTAGGCFVAGTLVSVLSPADSIEQTKIEDVKVGDLVLSFNLKTEQVEQKPVLALLQPIHNDIVEFVFSDGTKTRHTYDHPYYVLGKGWASYTPDLTVERYNVEDLEETVQIKVGDRCVTHERDLVTLDEINEITSDNITTYNFHVADNSNYFADGILVHNKPHEDYADASLRENTVPLEDIPASRFLNKMMNLQPHTFQWNEKASELSFKEEGGSFGLSAEDVERNFEEINFTWVGKDGYKRLAYWKFVPLLIEGYKVQNKQITELKEMVASLIANQNE